MGGVSVAGFLPGFGRGGTTHSFEINEEGVAGFPAQGEAAASELDGGFMQTEGWLEAA